VAAPLAAPPPSLFRPAPWYLKVLPFGIGQFANRDVAGGAAFLAVEAGLGAANIALAVANRMRRLPTGFPNTPGSEALYWAQQVTAAAFYATLIIGLVDAFAWSPARGGAGMALTASGDGSGSALQLSW
jgi:hypothetical protein